MIQDISQSPALELKNTLYRLYPVPEIRAGVLCAALVKTFQDMGISSFAGMCDAFRGAIREIAKQTRTTSANPRS